MKRCIFLILLSFLFLGFLTNQQPQWKGTITEEDGVKVIKNSNEPLYGEITFEVEEDLSIGNEEDENSYFYQNVNLTVDTDGNIYVLDWALFRVQKFDKNGNYILTFGRKGQGPGEFEQLHGIQMDLEGRICVHDRHMIHAFTPDGQLETCINLHRFFSSYSFIDSGSILCLLSTRVSDGLEENIALLNADGSLSRKYFDSKRPIPVFRFKGRIHLGGNPYNPRLYLSPWSGGSAVYGLSSEYKLYFINSSGELAFISTKKEEAEIISEREKNEFFKGTHRSEQRMSKRYPDRKALSMAEIKKVYAFPEYKPFFKQILTDDKANVYVWKFPSYGKKPFVHWFDYFNNEGHYLYKINMSLLPRLIKDGFVYRDRWDEENEFFQIKRYKIKNWDQIKEGI